MGARGQRSRSWLWIAVFVGLWGTLVAPSPVPTNVAAAGDDQAAGRIAADSVAACSPRPKVTLTVVRETGGVRATLTAGTSPGLPDNRLKALRLGATVGATVELNGQVLAGNSTHQLPTGTQTVSLVVRRTGPSGAVTIPLTVTDDCGDWPTFVGGGASLFDPPTCAPRPEVSMVVARENGGLRATLTAGASPGAPANRLVALRLGAAADATVELDGRMLAQDVTYPLPARPQAISLLVRRTASTGAVTVPLTITDDCGDWPTLVGGDGSLFGPPAVPGQQCPDWVHEAYVAAGPDGRPYPTWHPPTDPTYRCWFGHEHGADPTGAPALRGRAVVFGYAASRADLTEAHTGYKVHRWDDVRGPAPTGHDGASLLMVVHQGTRAPDRFASPFHSVSFDYVNGGDGREVHVQMLAPFGTLVAGCGVDDPGAVWTQQANAPGIRQAPVDRCFAAPWVPYEDWLTAMYVGLAPDGSWRAYLDPHFAVFNPNTYCVPAGGACQAAYSDVRAGTGRDPLGAASLFKGTRREAYLNQVRLANAGNSATVWTDPYGRASSQHAAGAIGQYVSPLTTVPTDESLVFGSGGVYDDGTVRVPN